MPEVLMLGFTGLVLIVLAKGAIALVPKWISTALFTLGVILVFGCLIATGVWRVRWLLGQ